MYFDYTDYISVNDDLLLRELTKLPPWQSIQKVCDFFSFAVDHLTRNGSIEEFHVRDDSIIHKSAVIEKNVTIKSFVFVDEDCLIAAGSYLRGGVFVSRNCIIGPGSEIKSSILFPETRIAHFNFVGDSFLGTGVNLEAGSIIANYRNESLQQETIRVNIDGNIVDTRVNKFGGLIGDGVRVGANSVIAPGSLIKRQTIIERLTLVDQARDANQPRTEN